MAYRERSLSLSPSKSRYIYKFKMLVSGLRNTRLFTKGVWVGMGSWKTMCMGVGFALEKRAVRGPWGSWLERAVGPVRPWKLLEPSGRSLPLTCEQVASEVMADITGFSPDRLGDWPARHVRQLSLIVPFLENSHVLVLCWFLHPHYFWGP